MPFITKYSIAPDTHSRNQIKRNKWNRTNSQKQTTSEQQRQYQSAAVFTKRFASILLDVFHLLVVSWVYLPIQNNWENSIGIQTRLFWGEPFNESLSEGDLLSLGLRSANGPGAEVVKWMRFPHRKMSLATYEKCWLWKWIWRIQLTKLMLLYFFTFKTF